jgi:hypothetical protein
MDLRISHLPTAITASNDSLLAIVVDGETAKITKKITRNDFLNNIPSNPGNKDNLEGSYMRTIYSRTNTIVYNVGTASDFFTGSSNFGSRYFPESFFTNSVNYVDKIIHFRITGKWGDEVPTPTVQITSKFGSDILVTATISGSQVNNHPSEIFGEIIFNNGNAIACYSIGWCSNNGDFKRYALSDASTPIGVTGFSGGDFAIVMGSNTTNSFTTYLGYIQVWN